MMMQRPKLRVCIIWVEINRQTSLVCTGQDHSFCLSSGKSITMMRTTLRSCGVEMSELSLLMR